MSDVALSIAGVQVKINGTVLADSVQLVEARIEMAMSATTMCDITVLASRTADDTSVSMVPSGVSIGAAVTVSGGYGGSLAQVFEGEIVAVTWDIGQRGEYVVIRAADKSHRLFRSSTHKAMLDQTYSDVLSSMAGDAGLQASCSSSALNSRVKYLLQYKSAGEMLRSITDITGTWWTFSGTTLKVSDPPDGAAAATVTYGRDLLKFQARVSGVAAISDVKVLGWDNAQSQAIVGQSNDSSMLVPAGLDGMLNDGRTSSTSSVITSHHVVADQSAANTLANSLYRRAVGSQLQMRFECSVPHFDTFVAGARVKFDGLGPDLNGVYTLASVVHTASNGEWRTSGTTGTLEPPTLPEIAASGATTPWPMLGPVVGVVTNIANDEFPGMVKVKLVTLGEQVESNWARVIGLGAGHNRGMMMMPDVNDEVLVVFEQGDPARPIVVGGLWSSTNANALGNADYSTSGGLTTWVIRSKNDQRITIMDGSDAEKQYVKISFGADDVHLHVGKDKVELVSNSGKPLEVKAGDSSMKLDGNGAMTLTSNTIKLDAKQDVTIEGANVNIKAKAEFKAEGTAGVTIKSSALGSVEASGPLALKGAVVNVN
jgi:hypothetical protein